MINPFRTEPEAFATVVQVSAAAIAVGLAAFLGGGWAALGVFLALAVGAAIAAVSTGRSRGGAADVARLGPMPAGVRLDAVDETHRLLVVANETLVGEALHAEVERRVAGRREQVLVVAPVLNTKLRHWASDTDGATHEARRRLERSLAALTDRGIEAFGRIGADDPLQALEDALREFAADEIVISTHPPSRSHWLERGLVPRARKRVPLPITHVIVDLDREQASVERVGAAVG